MKVYYEPSEEVRNSSITIGTFDGLHLGHRVIIERTCEEGRRRNLPAGVITFEPTPYLFFHREFPFLLTPLPEKLLLLQKTGIDFVRIMKFDEKLANISAVHFLLKIEREIAPKVIVVGYDFAFGKNREGDIRFLKSACLRHGFELVVIPVVKKSGIPVKSTTIREKLLLGNLRIANLLLGRRYAIEGKVAKGEGRGKNLGFPTLNIELQAKDKLLPVDGVYAVYLRVLLSQLPPFKGVMNIGVRPTFDGQERKIEVHLITGEVEELAGILQSSVPAGARVEVGIEKRIRPEMKFPGDEELRNQIKDDIEQAKRILC